MEVDILAFIATALFILAPTVFLLVLIENFDNLNNRVGSKNCLNLARLNLTSRTHLGLVPKKNEFNISFRDFSFINIYNT